MVPTSNIKTLATKQKTTKKQITGWIVETNITKQTFEKVRRYIYISWIDNRNDAMYTFFPYMVPGN